MESVMARYDRSVRTSRGTVIQFLYGEDGMDAVYIENQELKHWSLNKEQFDRVYRIDLHHER